MTGKFSSYTPGITAPVGGDYFLGVDASDHTFGSTGTNKETLFEDLAAAMHGLKFRTGTGALGSTAATITASDITAAQSAGFLGMFLDPRFIWDLSGLVIKDVRNFILASQMVGSVGYNGGVIYNSGFGYCITDTGTPADGIQIYSDSVTETQGIMLSGLALVGANPGSVLHFGGRQRRCMVQNCFVNNTNTSATTVAAASGGTAVSTFTGTQTITVATNGAVPFASSGNIYTQTTNGLAAFSYTGKTASTFTNCTLLGGTGNLTTGNAVQQMATALTVDTGLRGENSEDQTFRSLSLAASIGPALGIDINNLAQHCNDTLWDDIATHSGGMCSLAALGGSGHNFVNYYDRSNPNVATVWNQGATLIFRGGEDQNSNATGLSHLVAAASTVIENRQITQVSNTVTAAVLSGAGLRFRGRCVANGAQTITNQGVLDLSDPAGVWSSLTVTGSGGSIALGNYVPSSSYPLSISGYTGNIVQPPPLNVAATATAGFALQNGTPTILTWTTPNDGQVHALNIVGLCSTAGATTGGLVRLNYTNPLGNAATFAPSGAWAGSVGAATNTVADQSVLVAPNTTVTLTQVSALTVGTSTVYAQLLSS